MLIKQKNILIKSLSGIILYMLSFNNKIICIHFFLVISLIILDTVFDVLLQNNFTLAASS